LDKTSLKAEKNTDSLKIDDNSKKLSVSKNFRPDAQRLKQRIKKRKTKAVI
jgi:hypothetical protein